MPRSAEPRPPMSTTSLPEDADPLPTQTAKVRPPVLASDILRDDVAPVAPARRAIRLWLALFSLVFLAIALFAQVGLGARANATGAYATAAVALLGVVLPVPYAIRAVLAM